MRIVETMQKADWPAIISRVVGVAVLLAGVLLAAALCTTTPQDNSVFGIFDSRSTPADSIRHLSHFVLGVTGVIFLVHSSPSPTCLSAAGSAPTDFNFGREMIRVEDEPAHPALQR